MKYKTPYSLVIGSHPGPIDGLTSHGNGHSDETVMAGTMVLTSCTCKYEHSFAPSEGFLGPALESSIAGSDGQVLLQQTRLQ